MLVIRQLFRSFREGDRVHRVLAGADATLARGEVVAVAGRSGSGKSTLLNIVSGIERADSGSVEFDGREVSSLAEPARTLFRRAHVGFVYQFFNLIPTLDVLENVRLMLELNGVAPRAAGAARAPTLDAVGLADGAPAAPWTSSRAVSSSASRSRARSWHEPALILADEPTGNLDDATGARGAGRCCLGSRARAARRFSW